MLLSSSISQPGSVSIDHLCSVPDNVSCTHVNLSSVFKSAKCRTDEGVCWQWKGTNFPTTEHSNHDNTYCSEGRRQLGRFFQKVQYGTTANNRETCHDHWNAHGETIEAAQPGLKEPCRKSHILDAFAAVNALKNYNNISAILYFHR